MNFLFIFFIFLCLNTNAYSKNHVSQPIEILLLKRIQLFNLVKYDNGSFYDGGILIDSRFRDVLTPNGFGTMSYHDKSKYIGRWDNGYRNIQGKMIYLDGANYEGSWSDGERIGKGSYTFKNGKIILGEFSYGYFGWGIYKISQIHYTWYAFLFWLEIIFKDEDFNVGNEKNLYFKYYDNLKYF